MWENLNIPPGMEVVKKVVEAWDKGFVQPYLLENMRVRGLSQDQLKIIESLRWWESLITPCYANELLLLNLVSLARKVPDGFGVSDLEANYQVYKYFAMRSNKYFSLATMAEVLRWICGHEDLDALGMVPMIEDPRSYRMIVPITETETVLKLALENCKLAQTRLENIRSNPMSVVALPRQEEVDALIRRRVLEEPFPWDGVLKKLYLKQGGPLPNQGPDTA